MQIEKEHEDEYYELGIVVHFNLSLNEEKTAKQSENRGVDRKSLDVIESRIDIGFVVVLQLKLNEQEEHADQGLDQNWEGIKERATDDEQDLSGVSDYDLPEEGSVLQTHEVQSVVCDHIFVIEILTVGVEPPKHKDGEADDPERDEWDSYEQRVL